MSAPLLLKDAAATAALGGALAGFLRPGDVVFLIGALGAGKTSLARGAIEALSGEADAPSPTYTLVQTYDGKTGPLWHADLYRLPAAAASGDLVELGLDDAFAEAIVLIEWPDRLGDQAPADRLEVRLTPRADGAGREARIAGIGAWKVRVDDEFCDALRQACGH